MDQRRHGWTDEQMERIVGNLLRIGVTVAALVVLSGGIVYLMQSAGDLPHLAVFQGEPADLRSVAGIVRDAIRLRPAALIQFGLLLLIATPVVRVAFSILAFALQRDYTYVIVTLIVFLVLMSSIMGGCP